MNQKINWQKNIKHITGLMILFFLLMLLPSQSVYAATITVNSTADNITAGDGNCTLREAIMNANSDSDTTSGDCLAGTGNDTINLPAGTYTLVLTGVNEDPNRTGDLDITDGHGLTITGTALDARTTIIEAGTTNSNGIDRVLHITGVLTIEHVTIRHGIQNGIAGGIWNQGDLTINSSIITQNSTYGGSRDGGAIRNQGTLIINNSTLSYNTAARNGGAIHQQGGSIIINNSTISNNTASNETQGVGAAIYVNSGTVTINYSTIASNNASSNSGTGGGIFNNGAYIINIKSTIIADNTANTDPDCSGTVTSHGYNLIENTSGCTINGTTTNNVTGSDPQLKPLGNYGGSTDTHELEETSLAMDGGESSSCTAIGGSPVLRDQRGGSRPQNKCDIGSYEFGALAVDLATFSVTNEGSHLRLEWATVWENNNLGFNLYRSTTAEFSETERLNEELISAAAPGSGSGLTYEYDDDDLLLGTTYYYWLGDMDVGGNETLHGPISIDYDHIPTSVSISRFESDTPSNLSWLVMLTVLGMTIAALSMPPR